MVARVASTVDLGTVSERSVVRRVKLFLEGRGWLVMKTHGGPYSEAGMPDLLAWKKDQPCLALEVKRPGGRGRVTPLQQRMLNQMAAHGVCTAVVTGIQDLPEVARE